MSRTTSRWILYPLAVASALLALLVLVLWVRSGRYSDYGRLGYFHRQVTVMSRPNGINVSSWPDPAWMANPGIQVASYEYDVRNAFGAWASRPSDADLRFGFGLKRLRFSNDPAPRLGAFECVLPSWFLLLVLLSPPAAVLHRWRRVQHRRRHGLCATCGYDVRATPGRCPECGTEPAARPPDNQPLQRTGDASG